jgi:hypothetical protein
MEFFTAAMSSAVMASLVYIGTAATGRENLASLEIDMIAMAAIVTFISMMVANHPEWLS